MLETHSEPGWPSETVVPTCKTKQTTPIINFTLQHCLDLLDSCFMMGVTKLHQIKCMGYVFVCTSAPPPVPEGKRSWTEKACLHCRNPLVQFDRRQCLHNTAQLLSAPPLQLVIDMLASSKYPMSPYGYTVYHMHTLSMGTSMNNLAKSHVQSFRPPPLCTVSLMSLP